MKEMTPERWAKVRARGKTRFLAFHAFVGWVIPILVYGSLYGLELLVRSGNGPRPIPWGRALFWAFFWGFTQCLRASDRWVRLEKEYGPPFKGAAGVDPPEAPPPSPYSFESLAAAEGPFFEDFYRIYAESITVREQKPRDQIAALVEQPDYRVLLARKSGRIVGFSVLFLPSQEPFALLEYMAIQEADRSGGIGAELFRRSLPDRPVLLEVDSDLSGDQAINQRRILFYRRLGCRRVEGISYILPLPLEGPPPEMDLMIHVPPAIDRLSKSELERWLKVIYRDVYRCSPEDSRIDRMMESVADPVRIV